MDYQTKPTSRNDLRRYYEGKHYAVTGIGTNGFIVSVYPKKMKGDNN